MKKILLLSIFSIIAHFTFAQAGTNDPTFNIFDDGTFGNGQGFNNDVISTAIQSDGKIIVGGDFTSFNGISTSSIARLNTNGASDTSFNNNIGLGFDYGVSSIAIQADGKIIVVGDFTSFNGTSRNHIARLNTNGTLDTSFNPGTGLNNLSRRIVIQADGKIIVGGDFTSFNGTQINRIARLNINGTLDTSFNIGTGFDYKVSSIAIQPDGKIIVGGNFTAFSGIPINSIARLNTNGTLDTSFNPGTGFNYGYSSMAIQSDGKIIVVGDFISFNGTLINRIARLNTNGTLDTTFNPGTGLNNWGGEIAIQGDGKIIVGGDFTSFNGTTKSRIVRLNTNGTLDTSFNPGTGFDYWVIGIAIQGNGKIIIGGDFFSFNGISRTRIVRLNTNGTLDKSFNPEPGFNKSVYSTVIQGDGKIIVGGDFTSFNDTIMNSIARLTTNGTLDTSFNPGTGFDYGVSSIATQADGKIIVGGHFTSFNGTQINRIARLKTNGTLDTSFNPGTGFNYWVRTIAIQTDGKIIVGGDFLYFNGIPMYSITRLNNNGTLDTSFNIGTAFNGGIQAMALQGDGKVIVVGDFTSFNGTTRSGIARLNTNGTLDTGFNPGTGFNSRVSSVVIQGDGKIIAGGQFSSFNGTAKNKIARLNSNGTLDTNFNPGSGFNGEVTTTVIQGDGKIIVGGMNFTSFNGTPINRIARLNTNGTLDSNFNPGSGFDYWVNTIAIQGDGKIIVGGSFYFFNGIYRTNITRLNGDCTASLNLTTNLNGSIITSNESGASYQWINCNTNQLINGATNQTYTTTNSGSYACIVSKNSCSDTTACVSITSVFDISSNTQKATLIYPNPSTGQFFVKDADINSTITITNILGEVLYNNIITNNEQLIDLSNQPKGVYFIQTILENHITSAKIMIK